MAKPIKKQNKDGTTSYSVRVYLGRNQKGKVITKSKTLNPPPGLKGKKLEKWLQKEADDYEQAAINGTLQSDMLFNELLEKFFTEHAEKQTRSRTVAGYASMRPRVSQALGHLKLSKIKPCHIMDFYNNLSEDGVRMDSKYSATTALLDKLPRGKRKPIEKAAGIAERTMNTVCKGETVSRQTAEKVAEAAGIPFSKAFKEHSRNSGKLSGNTIHHYHAFLSSVFSRAVVWQLIDSNPCDRVQPPKWKMAEAEVLTYEELVKMYIALDTEELMFATVIKLALYTGARRGELCGLRWSDIDFEHNTIHIARQVQTITGKGEVITELKTKKANRIAGYPQSCMDMLERYHKYQLEQRIKVGSKWEKTINVFGKTVENDMVFTRWNGAPLSPDTLTRDFRRFIDKNGLNPAIHFHSLRHQCAYELIESDLNIPVTEISAHLGHAQTSTTLNIYAPAFQRRQAKVTKALGNIFETIENKAHA